jgi:hypothetical protein
MDQTFAAIKRPMWAIGEQGWDHAGAHVEDSQVITKVFAWSIEREKL